MIRRIYLILIKYIRFMFFCVFYFSNLWNYLIIMFLLKFEIIFIYYFFVGIYYGKVLF